MGIRVKLRSNEHLDKTLRRFKRRCEKEDLFKDVLKNSYFEKPCEDRRRQKRKIEKEKKKKKIEEEQNRKFTI